MLCDRCVRNASCRDFVGGGQCVREQKRFARVVRRFMREYDLGAVADRILVERAAMCVLKIARAEAYEASVGISARSVFDRSIDRSTSPKG